MSTSTYTRVENTLVSGSALLSGLSAGDVKALNFAQSVDPEPALAYSLTAAATANTDVSVANLIQAAISQQDVVCGAQGGGADQALALEPDSVSAARGYIGLFNLSSQAATGPGKRLLTFQNSGVLAATQDVLLQVASGANGGYVQVANNGAGAGASGVLFDVSVAQSGNAPGGKKHVYVYATNTSTSAPNVVFDIQSNNLA